MEYLLSPAALPLSPASPTFVKIDEPVSTYCELRFRVYVRFEVIFFFPLSVLQVLTNSSCYLPNIRASW